MDTEALISAICARVLEKVSALEEAGQGKDLEAAGIGEDGPVPPHEFVEATHLAHHLVTGTQVEVIGVGQLNLAAYILQILC